MWLFFVLLSRTQISETERQLDMAQENFEKISRTIKKEFEIFEARKNLDFKHTIVKYLERMLKWVSISSLADQLYS